MNFKLNKFRKYWKWLSRWVSELSFFFIYRSCGLGEKNGLGGSNERIYGFRGFGFFFFDE